MALSRIVVFFSVLGLDATCGALPLGTEAEILEIMQSRNSPGYAPENVADFIARGWWKAAREFIALSPREADGRVQDVLETAVRSEVRALKQNADSLLLALSPDDASKIGMVHCAFQWAQNSSAIFLQIKFAHRWASPGALEVHDQVIEVSECCLNFSAAGKHSQLRKKYVLELLFHGDVDSRRWSWKSASAGRLIVEIKKRTPGKWLRLLEGKERPANMAIWDEMSKKYSKELDEFVEAQALERGERVITTKKVDEELAEAEEEEKHLEGQKKCVDSKLSPFHGNKLIPRLCDDYWPPRMLGKQGRNARWLVLFYLPSEPCTAHVASKCKKHKAEQKKRNEDLHEFWKTMNSRSPSSVKVGAVNCNEHASFCLKSGVKSMPSVQLYKKGKRKLYLGDLHVDKLIPFAEDEEGGWEATTFESKAEEEAHEQGRKKCVDSKSSPFHGDKLIPRLCDEYWPPRMTGARGKSSRWLVLFYLPSRPCTAHIASKCKKQEAEQKKSNEQLREFWKTVNARSPSSVNVGEVNCNEHVAFCQKARVKSWPSVQMAHDGKRKFYKGELQSDKLIAFALQ